MERACEKRKINVVILDTAGRLHIDEDMMKELADIKECEVDQTILVVDAMTGQDAVNVAKTFKEKVGIDGVSYKIGRRYQRRCGIFHSRQSPENRFYMWVWERNFQIWNSSIRTVWHPVFWEWEM